MRPIDGRSLFRGESPCSNVPKATHNRKKGVGNLRPSRQSEALIDGLKIELFEDIRLIIKHHTHIFREPEHPENRFCTFSPLCTQNHFVSLMFAYVSHKSIKVKAKSEYRNDTSNASPNDETQELSTKNWVNN
jgi:hypothetical protein